MHSSTQLYLKEFFSNYLNKKQHADSVNLLGSSLEVLHELIQSYALDHQISLEIGNPKQTGCAIQDSQYKLQEIFQTIYNKLRLVFTHFDECDSKNREDPHSSQRSIWENPTDDELYSILNGYKIDNKSLKQSIKALNKKIQQKQDIISQLQIQAQSWSKRDKSYCQKIDSLSAQVTELKCELESKIEENEARAREIQCYAKDVELLTGQLTASNQKIQQLEAQNCLTQLQNKELQSQISRTENVFVSLQAQVDNRLKNISEEISEKLHSKQNWEMPACQLLRRFMKIKNQG